MGIQHNQCEMRVRKETKTFPQKSSWIYYFIIDTLMKDLCLPIFDYKSQTKHTFILYLRLIIKDLKSDVLHSKLKFNK